MPALPRRARRLLLPAVTAGVLSAATTAWADDSPSPYLAPAGDLQLGPIRYRPWGGHHPTRTGYELGGGQAPVARYAPFSLGGTQGVRLRWFPDQGVSFSFFYEGWASAAVGPVQLEGRISLTSVGVDHLLGHWSLFGLSPRTAVGVAVRSGRFVAGLFAFSEYTWRWLGQDLLVHGLYLDLRAEGKREALR